MGCWVSRERSAPLDVISFERQIDQNQLPAPGSTHPAVAEMLRLGAACGADTLSTVAAVVGSPRSAPNGRIPPYRAYYLLEEP